jgi:precorrin-6B methylase 2
MITRLALTRRIACLVVVAAGLGFTPALAQEEPKLDVIFVPTPQEVVDRMLEMAEVKPNDFVIDLGCGDGRMVVTAAKKYGARGYGVDIHPQRIKESNENAQKAGVTDKVSFKIADLFQEDISKANVMTMYLLRDINVRLRPKILSDMKPGSRIVSHAFDMAEWEPDQRANVDGRNIFFWYVPAKVEGKWQVEGDQKFALELNQKFQMVSGKADIGGNSVDISNGRLKGAELTFTIDNGGKKQEYKGRVEGNEITAIGGNWKARKA